jgi:hypothetical protein
VLYVAAAFGLAAVTARVMLRGNDGDRRHVLWSAAATTTIGLVFALVAVITGNVALFYAGALLVLVGLPLSGITMIAVYRDRQRVLHPFD